MAIVQEHEQMLQACTCIMNADQWLGSNDWCKRGRHGDCDESIEADKNCAPCM